MNTGLFVQDGRCRFREPQREERLDAGMLPVHGPAVARGKRLRVRKVDTMGLDERKSVGLVLVS